MLLWINRFFCVPFIAHDEVVVNRKENAAVYLVLVRVVIISPKTPIMARWTVVHTLKCVL